jgi:hypothetical protein
MSKYQTISLDNPNYRGGISSFTHEDQLLTLDTINLIRYKTRFLTKVRKTRGCWYWTASTFLNSGRARASLGTRSVVAARVSYVLHKGKIKDKLVCHKCDNILCVNPKHLFLGTFKDNTQDMIQKGRKFRTLGETNGSVKLTEKQVIQIRKLFKEGFNYSKLSKKFSVTTSNIGLIVNRKTWPHIK